MPDESDAKQILTAYPLENWKRPPGCPRITWMKTTQQDYWTSPWTKQFDVAQNRPLWRIMSMFGIMHARNDDDEWWCAHSVTQPTVSEQLCHGETNVSVDVVDWAVCGSILQLFIVADETMFTGHGYDRTWQSFGRTGSWAGSSSQCWARSCQGTHEPSAGTEWM